MGKKKPIYQYDKEGNFIKRWESTVQASQELGIPASSISGCITNKVKTASGFVFTRGEQANPVIEGNKKEENNEFDNILLSHELLLFRAGNCFKKKITHEIHCYSEENANKIADKFSSSFGKYGWVVDWTYNVIDKYYIVECRRV